MSHHMRSTNERVLARHRIKRSFAAVDYPPAARGIIDDDSDEGDDVDDEDEDDPLFHPHGVAASPSIRLLPPAVISSPSPVSIKPVVAPSPQPLSSVSRVITPLPTPSPSRLPVAVPPPSRPPPPSPSPSLSSSTSHTPIPSIATFQSVPVSSSAILATPTPDSGSSDGTSTKVEGSSRVSPGAIGGIVTAIILITLALIAFFVRKVYLRRRAQKRNTWGAGLVPALENKRETVYGGQPYMGQPLSPNNNTAVHKRLPDAPRMDEMTQNAGHQPLGFQIASALSPPPPSFGSTSPYMLPPPSVKSIPPGSPIMSPSVTEIATVARTFIPSLPDELHIANGEQIRVLNAYDDGWALCANMRGEQGVVPVECLERSNTPLEMQLQLHNEFGVDSSRASKRMSSLTPNVGGTY